MNKRKDDLRERLAAAYAQIVGEVAPADAAPVIALVEPFVEASRDTVTPPAAAVDWAAMAKNLASARALLAAHEAYVQMMDEEDAVEALLLS